MIRVRAVVENTALPGSDFRAEHGISWHIETRHGQLLFDTGSSGEVMVHNAALLGIDWQALDAAALSHAHYDHTGGLRHLFAHTRPTLPLYAHPDLFRPRYANTGSEFRAIGIAASRDEIAAHADLRLSADPVEMLPGVWTTGEITNRSYFEGRSASHQIKTDDGSGWLPDPYRDDFSLVLHTEQGLVVLLGCGHAGLLNILAQVKQQFAGDIIAVAGGTHLTSADETMLHQAITELDTIYRSPRLYPCHCTGERAFNALKAAFGDRVQPSPAGTVLEFD
jgi:7,8-dihydropterin-6-yl-methyl-4-(beta-D-ribofuranosyl)aminobenzene 5'-phosphate synthase